VIWKTVPGIFTADPELVPGAKLLRELTFSEAEEIGRRGARVLYAAALEPLRDDGTTIVRVAAPLTRTKRWTSVLPESHKSVRKTRAVGIALQTGLRSITIDQEEIHKHLDVRKSDAKVKVNLSDTIRRNSAYQWESDREKTLLVPESSFSTLTEALRTLGVNITDGQKFSALSTIFRAPESGFPADELTEQVLRALKPYRVSSFLRLERSLVAFLPSDDALPALKKLHRSLFGA
jgi:aspartokinase